MIRDLPAGRAKCLLVLLVACTAETTPDDSTATVQVQSPASAASTALGAAATFDTVFGVVAARNDTTCLGIPTPSSALVDSIVVVLPKANRTFSAEIMHPLATCPHEPPGMSLAFYRLSAPDFEPGNLGIAVPRRAVLSGEPPRTDVDRNGDPDTYRSCTSSEGVHLTVWSGEALRSRRLWHYYYYLGYDTEPNCVEADYIDMPADSTARYK
jgi:hypothetical protein